MLMSERRDWYGWVMVSCRFVYGFILLGTVKSFGILLYDIAFDLNTSVGNVGLAFGFCNGFTYLMSPVSALLYRSNNGRTMAIVGAGIVSVSLIVASFSRDIHVFTLLLVCAGTGYSLIHVVMTMMISHYFTDNFAVAFGIASTGFPLGMMLLPIVAEQLSTIYGWRGTIFLFGGINLHLMIAAMLVKEPMTRYESLECDNHENEEPTLPMGSDCLNSESITISGESSHESKSEHGNTHTDTDNEMEDNGIFRNECPCCFRCNFSTAICFLTNTENGRSTFTKLANAFGYAMFADAPHSILLILSVFLGYMAYASWIVYLIPRALARGFPPNQAVYLATIAGIGSFLGRIGQAIVVDRKWCPCLVLSITLTYVNAAVFFVDPLLTAFPLLCVGAAVGACCMGSPLTLNVMIIRGIISDDHFETAVGLVSLACGLGSALGVFVSGQVVDHTHSYGTMSLVLGGVEVFKGILLIATQVGVWKRRQGE